MLDRLFLFLALVLVCSARGGWEGKGEGRFNYTEEENPSFSQEFSMTTYMGVDVMRTQLGDFNGDGVQVFVLFCFVLFCFVLFCFVLFCFVLFCFVLFCFVLFCFVLFCLLFGG